MSFGLVRSIRKLFEKEEHTDLTISDIIRFYSTPPEDIFSMFDKLVTMCGVTLPQENATIFAPTNTALTKMFREYGKGFKDPMSFYSGIDKKKLRNIIAYHIIEEPVTYEEITSTEGGTEDGDVTKQYDASNGQVLAVIIDDEGVRVKDVQTDSKDKKILELFEAKNNGYIYKISGLLLPSDTTL
jgi:uncharacterized surface protein with fasciclin (FAS1) repeats